MFELERGDAAELDASRAGVTARDDRRGLPPVEAVSPTPSQHGGWLRVPPVGWRRQYVIAIASTLRC